MVGLDGTQNLCSWVVSNLLHDQNVFLFGQDGRTDRTRSHWMREPDAVYFLFYKSRGWYVHRIQWQRIFAFVQPVSSRLCARMPKSRTLCRYPECLRKFSHEIDFACLWPLDAASRGRSGLEPSVGVGVYDFQRCKNCFTMFFLCVFSATLYLEKKCVRRIPTYTLSMPLRFCKTSEMPRR